MQRNGKEHFPRLIDNSEMSLIRSEPSSTHSVARGHVNENRLIRQGHSGGSSVEKAVSWPGATEIGRAVKSRFGPESVEGRTPP